MKLAINLPLAVFWQPMARHTLCADISGAIAAGSLSCCGYLGCEPNVLKARGVAGAAALSAKEPSSATFDCDGIRKDLRTMVAERTPGASRCR